MNYAYYCMDNPDHLMFKANVDGAKCPQCDGLVNVIEVSDEMYKELMSYRKLKEYLPLFKRMAYNNKDIAEILTEGSK